MFPALRPQANLLSAGLADRIIDEGFAILEKTGVFVENAEARRLLGAAGAELDEARERVRIPRSLMEGLLRHTPDTITLADRTGGREFTLGGDEVHFDPGSAGVRILDQETRRERTPTTSDLVDFVRVADACANLDLQSTGLVARDIPEILADSFRLYVGLLFSAKPIVTGTFRVAGFEPMREMLAAVRGGSEALRKRPLAIFDACPSPPLKWSNLTAQSLIDCARAGIPSELISMGMTGAASPATITATLVQHVVENLAGLAIAQAAAPGAPIIFGGSPSSFDMRKGTTPMGAMETMMIDMAYAQLGKRLELPTHAYMALSDAKTNDAQAGYETGIGAVLAALAGINVVSGPGMMDYESTISLEKLLIDDEICGLALRLIKGIVQREDPIALHLFEDFDPAISFLTLDHTRKWYRQDHSTVKLADRDTYDAWLAAGGKTIDERAHEEVVKILAKPVVSVDERLQTELRRIMRADAAANGVADFPPPLE
ncbi:MAG: trimethylamine methyltransferase family protein [Candidatus Aminicenantes bacterium]|nr:trimethylamine methyltransferase family protein [Candidatus Aminicenantes bacterium]